MISGDLSECIPEGIPAMSINGSKVKRESLSLERIKFIEARFIKVHLVTSIASNQNDVKN